MSQAALDGVGRRLDVDHVDRPYGDADRARAHARIRHAAATDPGGAWVAVDDTTGDVVGLCLAVRREGLWFLSLLVVAEAAQGQGLGARLLDASLAIAEGATGGLIAASRDPRAMRRYMLAGFRLQPCFGAAGPLDRALLPGALGVRDGDLARDAELCAAVDVTLRGAPHGPDLGACLAAGARLLVAEDGIERGYALARSGQVWLVGATEERLAQRLLWAALAGVDGDDRSGGPTDGTGAGAPGQRAVDVSWLTGRQQWALDVTLAARLPLRLSGSLASRGTVGPLRPYLPNGAWG